MVTNPIHAHAPVQHKCFCTGCRNVSHHPRPGLEYLHLHQQNLRDMRIRWHALWTHLVASSGKFLGAHLPKPGNNRGQLWASGSAASHRFERPHRSEVQRSSLRG